MSEPAITPSGEGADADERAGDSTVRELRDLDARRVVEEIVASRRIADQHEARLLALAVHFVDLHPVTAEHPAASWDPEETLPVASRLNPTRNRSARRAVRARRIWRTERIAGEGTPSVAEYAVEELGAALGVPYRTALTLLADALELCYRLPQLWALVQVGRLQAWKARQVAQLTMEVSPSAARFVDRHLAFDAAKNRVPAVGRLRALVHEALLQHDPDTAAAREEAALAKRGVWFEHRESTATTCMTATLDTLDALDLDNTLSDLADQLRQLGDTGPLDVRRAHALGSLARRDDMLDLTACDERQPQDVSQRPVLRLRNKTTTHLYVHVSLADLLTGRISNLPTDLTREAAQQMESRTATGWVEKLGPATLDLIQNWLTRVDAIHLRGVLHAGDPGTDGDWPAVDQHDPPEWMREIVILRDGHCIFPGCTVDARACDQDHIVRYIPIDEGGPPGQTSVENLACLCRRHHRLKTFTAWRYRRLPTGDYEWTSPTGHTYLASPTPRR